MTIRHFCDECGLEVTAAEEYCREHTNAMLHSVAVPDSPETAPAPRLDTLIDAELERLGWSSTTAPAGLATLDAWKTPTTDADDIVTLHDRQGVTLFKGRALLETLRTLPENIDYENLWQAIVPHMVAG